MPGGNFWGCADNVPTPKNEDEEIKEFVRIRKEVFNYDWREILKKL
jgi:hypothetical protein